MHVQFVIGNLVYINAWKWHLVIVIGQYCASPVALDSNACDEQQKSCNAMSQTCCVQASMSTNTVRSKLENPKSKSAREKALEFARSVPRPEMKRAASSGSSSGASTPKQQQQSSGLTEIEKLQAQHAVHRQKVESIRQEFVRMAAS